MFSFYTLAKRVVLRAQDEFVFPSINNISKWNSLNSQPIKIYIEEKSDCFGY